MSREPELRWTVPDSWAWASLSQLGDIVAGGTPSTKEPSYWSDEIHWISPADLTGYSAKTIKRGVKPGFPFWPWHGRSIHPRCPAYQVFSRCTLHITSAGKPQGPSVRSQTLIEWAERHSGRHCSLPNLFGAENC